MIHTICQTKTIGSQRIQRPKFHQTVKNHIYSMTKTIRMDPYHKATNNRNPLRLIGLISKVWTKVTADSNTSIKIDEYPYPK